MTTINGETSSLAAVVHAVMGGKFRVRLTDDGKPGTRRGRVLDDEGNDIGEAYDSVYKGEAWCVATRPYHGYATLDQVEIVGRCQGAD